MVCGYGTGGIPAAIDAADAGADVLVIEKLAEGGGCLRRCGGGVFGGPTSTQQALGIEDSADLVYQYFLKLGGGFTDPELERLHADNCGPNVDWLIELGAEIPLEASPSWAEELLMQPSTIEPGIRFCQTDDFYTQFGLPAIPRAHFFTPAPEYRGLGQLDWGSAWMEGLPGGTGVFQPLDDAAKARGVRIMTETGLVGLVATPDGEVLGVKALSGGNTLYIKAKKGVVITTGEWVNNEKMVMTYAPERLEETIMTHPDHAHGEGIIAAHAIGADLTMMWFNGNFGGGGLLINPKTEVIDVFGEVIPRLYAAPFAAGGAYYTYTGGSHVSCAICFGRIAGQNAATLDSWG